MKTMIRKATLADVESLLQLYNEATIKLIDQGINQWVYPWEKETINDLLPKIFVLVSNQKLVGALVISEKEMFNDHSFGAPALFLEKLVIHPSAQGNNLSSQLMDFARVQGESSRMSVYFDCWAGNKKLIKHYLNYAKQVAIVKEEDYQIALFQLD